VEHTAVLPSAIGTGIFW